MPFTLSYQPFFTGLGVIAGWSAAILGLSFYARKRIGAKRWRSLHRLTIAVWALAVVHTIGAGTDAGQVWLQAIMVTTGIPIVYLFLRRILPAEDRRPVTAPAATVRPTAARRSAPVGRAPADRRAAADARAAARRTAEVTR